MKYKPTAGLVLESPTDMQHVHGEHASMPDACLVWSVLLQDPADGQPAATAPAAAIADAAKPADAPASEVGAPVHMHAPSSKWCPALSALLSRLFYGAAWRSSAQALPLLCVLLVLGSFTPCPTCVLHLHCVIASLVAACWQERELHDWHACMFVLQAADNKQPEAASPAPAAAVPAAPASSPAAPASSPAAAGAAAAAEQSSASKQQAASKPEEPKAATDGQAAAKADDKPAAASTGGGFGGFGGFAAGGSGFGGVASTTGAFGTFGSGFGAGGGFGSVAAGKGEQNLVGDFTGRYVPVCTGCADVAASALHDFVVPVLVAWPASGPPSCSLRVAYTQVGQRCHGASLVSVGVN